MGCRKITYYKMLPPEHRAEIAAAVSTTDLRSQARFAAGQSPSSLEPSYKEEEADPMFMAEVVAQKALDGYETMDVDFVPAFQSSFSIAMLNRWSACTMGDSDAGTMLSSIV